MFIPVTKEHAKKALGNSFDEKLELDNVEITPMSNEELSKEMERLGAMYVDEKHIDPDTGEIKGIERVTMENRFGVNLSGDVRNVRVSPGTDKAIVGKLTLKESFTFTGMKSTLGSENHAYEWWEIWFLSPNGWRQGWYRGANGMSLWRNHYKTTASGRYLYYVDKRTNVYSGGKDLLGDISPGAYVYLESLDDCGKCGSSMKYWMLINGMYTPSGGFMTAAEMHAYAGIQYNGKVAYVNTNINKSPNTPNIRGRW